MQVTKTSETQSQAETTDKQPEAEVSSRKSRRKSILALSMLALAINGTAALYTLPSFDISSHIGSLAELLPHQRASAPLSDPVVAALKDIQSTQQQHVVSLQENSSSLQKNTALLQQDSTTLVFLRQSITDEQVDVKKISAQISTLIAKVDSLQSAMTPEVTSSIPTRRAYNRLSPMRKRMARQPRPVGPVSVGGAPLSIPGTKPPTQG
jgi:Spy/CpxP family protein refolding chaperone